MSNTEEKALLEYRLQAYIARNSKLQSRLSSTLGTLDVLQTTHQEELLSITTERDRLKLKLQRFVGFVESAKSEQDDMRDAIMKLIEKVEISNDYSKWPHSQIYLSSPADSSTPKQQHQPTSPEPGGIDSEELTSSLIKILPRKERDSERTAHTRTRDLANAQHKRDAELESCIKANADEHVTQGSPSHDSASSSSRREKERMISVGYEPIVRDELVSLFELIVARNRILETEVKISFKQLEEVRNAQRRISAPARASSNSMTNPLHPDDSLQPVDSKRSLPKERHSDQLIGLGSQINELGLKIDAFLAERKVIVKSIGLAALEVEPNLENPHHPSDELHLRLQLECDRLRRRETEVRDQLDDTRSDAREREIELLAEISALRQRLQQGTSLNYAEVSVQTELLPPANPENLLEPHEGEQSMELATPLIPTSVVTTHLTDPDDINILPHVARPLPSSRNQGDHASIGQEYNPVDPATEPESSSYVDPPTIPLPHSPELELEGLSAWEENSLSDFTVSALDFPLPPGFPSSTPSSMPGRSNTDDMLRMMGLNNGIRR